MQMWMNVWGLMCVGRAAVSTLLGPSGANTVTVGTECHGGATVRVSVLTRLRDLWLSTQQWTGLDPGLEGSCHGFCSSSQFCWDPVSPLSLHEVQSLSLCSQPLPDFHGSVCLVALLTFQLGICRSWCLQLRAQLVDEYSGLRPELITLSGCSLIWEYSAGVTWVHFSFSPSHLVAFFCLNCLLLHVFWNFHADCLKLCLTNLEPKTNSAR